MNGQGWKGKIQIQYPLWMFEERENLCTLQFGEKHSKLLDGDQGIIWVIYQDDHTLVLVSDYYLKNNEDDNDVILYDSMCRMFSSEAKTCGGRLLFDFDTNCGIDEAEIQRAVCFIENGFVKIGLR